MKSGHEGVFTRKGDDRLPIRELKGPSVGYIFEVAGRIARDLTRQAYADLARNIDTQVAVILQQYRRAS